MQILSKDPSHERERGPHAPRSGALILAERALRPQPVRCATTPRVSLLRRALYLDALLTALGAMALLAVPRFLLFTVLSQPAYPDYAPVRLLGVTGFALALVMVLVAHRAEDLWWWTWAFVVLEGGAAVVKTLHAAFGLPAGAAAWPWWAWALTSWAFALAFLWGIARAGTEAPPG